jgi:4-amino-4-deoxy-L-arabinose transferase-like glycosyltransferase
MKVDRWLVLAGFGIIMLYLLTHLVQLTALPVFADEAIYIRWAQLIIDDWQQYAFFPLNDGKTPLQMWLMVPLLLFFKDPLFAGRFLSVLTGIGQVLIMGWITHQLGGRKKAVALAMLLTTVLPFWYFHQRMALIDSLLGLWLALIIATTIKSQAVLSSYKKLPLFNHSVFWAGLSGLCFGLALWSKIPALLFIPALPLYVFTFTGNKNQPNRYLYRLSLVSGTVILGLAIFGLLKLNPAFGQLFRRGNDFLFPWQEVLLQGKWTQTIQNIPSYLKYFAAYFTWPLLLAVVAGLFANKNQRVFFVLFLSAAFFVGPIALLGRVVYPRYLFPAVVYLTAAAVLSFQHFHDRFFFAQKNLAKKMFFAVGGTLLLAQPLALSGLFIYYSLFAPNQTPFVPADQEQYLYEWSSGHGIKEVVGWLKAESTQESLAVATEGSFGTLPDGILMYLHRTDVSNLYVEGIGYPVTNLSPKYRARAGEFDRQLLVVNSHRLQIPRDQFELVAEFCRPDQAPCLQLWDISQAKDLLNPVSETSNSL